MLLCLAFATVLAVGVFFLVNVLAKTYVEKVYLSEEHKKERDAEYKASLQDYVLENQLFSNDTKKIAEWAQKHKYLYVMVYKNDELLFESGSYDEDDSEIGENKENDDKNPSGSVDGDGSENSSGSSESGKDNDSGKPKYNPNMTYKVSFYSGTADAFDILVSTFVKTHFCETFV